MATGPMLCLQALMLCLQALICLSLPWLTRLCHKVLVITRLTTQACYTTADVHLCTVRCYSPDLAIRQIASTCCPPWKAWKDSHLGKHPCGPAAQPWVVRASQSRQHGRPKCMIHLVTWFNKTSGVLVAVTAVLACHETWSACYLTSVRGEILKLWGIGHSVVHIFALSALQLLLIDVFRIQHGTACVDMDEIGCCRVGCMSDQYCYACSKTATFSINFEYYFGNIVQQTRYVQQFAATLPCLIRQQCVSGASRSYARMVAMVTCADDDA